MKLKISLILFILGLGLIIFSFGLRESYEKEMYQLYIDQQKDNLVEGWSKNWSKFVADHAQKNDGLKGHKLLIDRNGKLLTKEFFPKHHTKKENWSEFEKFSVVAKNNFLKIQFNKTGTWDRAIAIKRWIKINKEVPDIELSNYEKTLIDEKFKTSFNLLFNQIKKKSDYSNIGKNFEIDVSLVRSNDNGEIELFMPLRSYLEKILLLKFMDLNGINEVGLSENPLVLELKTGFNPLKFNMIREKIFLAIGFSFLILSIGFYFFELRNKKIALLKKVSFLNQLVHEVKTPITGIRLNSELLIKHGHDEELVEALLKSSNRLNDFFEDIVLINRNDTEPNYSDLSENDWKGFVNDIINEFQGRIHLVNNIDQPVKIDKGRVRVILRNLLKNAVRYGKKGKCEIFKEHDLINFKVSDEGPGISESDARKIFDEFYRAKSAKDISSDGLGIGLSIVSNLARQIKSEVILVNPGKKNAVFLFKVGNQNES